MNDSTDSDAPSVSEMRVEYAAEPNDVPPDRPRFSWRVETRKRAARQSAYRLLVARSETALADEHGEMWDSGRVESAESTNVTYDGTPLDPDTNYVWAVRVWHADGTTTGFSDPATFTTALSARSEWEGDWIGYVPEGTDTNGYRSQWHPAGDDVTEQVTIDLGESRRVEGVELHPASPFNGPKTPDGMAVSATYSADELGEGEVTNEGADGFGFPRGYRVVAAADSDFTDPTVLVDRTDEDVLNPGSETVAHDVDSEECRYLQVEATDLYEFDPGATPTELNAQLKTDEIREERRRWQVFALAAVVVRDGAGADLAVERPVSASSSVDGAGWSRDRLVDGVYESAAGTASPLLRTTVRLDCAVERARLYVCTLGYGECYVNGERIGDEVLDPGWTDYEERVLYDSYDVGDALEAGENALGLWLGNGWFNKNSRDWTGGGAPRAILQLNVGYADGRTRTVSTDGSWRAAPSPIVENDIYDGETYDARRERPGWATPGFNDTNWANASVVDAPGGDLLPQQTPPIRVIKTIEPESISDGEDGPVADFGQNLTGWVELDVSNASAGDEITIRHAEELHEDGSLALVDLRAADATDTYVASGEETGPYQPRFTYHGFRYAQVTGYPGDLGADDLRAHVVHTDMDRQGTFECSNEDLSQVQRNAVWGLRGNAHSVPTDCPQRDERYGWTGDGHISARAFMYNFDSVGFHEKWTRDHDDAQSEHGYVGDTVPYGYGTIPADPNWSITRVTIPWYLYRHYGDRAVLERHYEAMRRYVDYWQGVSDDGIVPSEYANYGDWLTFENADGRRGLPFELFNTAFQYRTTDLFARIAAVLSREADAARYDDRAAHVRDRFNEVFFDPDSATYGPGTQSSYAVPLFFGLVPDEHEDTVVSGLVEKVRRDGRKLKTGFLGSRPLLHTLVDHGHADLAYKIVSQPEQPGWVYMVRNGATTMWERWDSDDRVGSGMNSYNHSPFTFVSEWLFGSLAGLDLEMADGGGSGDRSTVEVAPAIVDDLDWVRARVETVNGPLGCEWARDDGVTATVTIPWNTTGSVSLPAGDGATVTEGGTPIRESDSAESLPPGISAARRDGNWLVLTVGSGTYEFAVEH